ncbi:MAG: tRNA (guanosine(37)-N1)-methyltransferase TrmD [Calditrichaeota bacterium]|nr:MAG: tRNA (guanosine(37)-N1)-methyltransferase TrmD [Calditrichota bacterium]
MRHFHIVTAFPNMFTHIFGESILKRAQDKQIAKIEVHDLRAFTSDKHKTVDDYPFGGGAGMILKPEPIFLCVENIIQKYELQNPRIILTSPAGKVFDQNYANHLAGDERPIIIICGHYKGVDERVRQYLVNEEISIGDYILTGGELPAMVIIDAVVRLLPGVLGDFESAASDSFQTGMLDHPHYTRPRDFRGMKVPDILLSGNHAKIDAWRKEMAQKRTEERRKAISRTKNKTN